MSWKVGEEAACPECDEEWVRDGGGGRNLEGLAGLLGGERELV